MLGLTLATHLAAVPRSGHRLLLLLLILVSGVTGACGRPASAPREEAGLESMEIFADRTRETGLDFVHANGMTGEYTIVEEMGSGGALFDYDNDGDLDLYLVQGVGADRLYRNTLETGALRWVDATEESGLAEMTPQYGMGVATGDYDNDGWTDLYVTAHGANRLLRNQGDGRFEDVTEVTGTGDDRFSIPALFYDYDGDGWLDLWVGNYVTYPEDAPPVCHDGVGARDYCGPEAFVAEPDRLLRNRGGGVDGADGPVTFEDVTATAGMAGAVAPALGGVAADFDGNGTLELYVANDGQPNQLWTRRGGGLADTVLEDRALLAGVALNADGQAEASMGIAAADFDQDGDLDLFVTHFLTETNTLYLGDGRGLFKDATAASGLGAASRIYTSFGTGAVDIDNDGLPDLPVVNGAVNRLEALARLGDPFPLHQPNQLFRNLSGGRFEEVTSRAGPAMTRSEVSRGAVFGDVDNDGDVDMVVVNNHGPARLALNQAGHRHPWLGLRLLVGSGPRDAYGARAAVLRGGRPVLWRWVRADGSYASAHDPRLLFSLGDTGLGEDPQIEGVRVVWPDGTREDFNDVLVGRYTVLQRNNVLHRGDA